VAGARREQDRQCLAEIELALKEHADDLAVYLVYDRASLIATRPGLARTYFAERCVPDAQLRRMRDAFLSVGAHAEILGGEHEFLAAMAVVRDCAQRKLQVIYNGLSYNVGKGAFEPGRKALLPLLADSYGLMCVNSNAYPCTFTLHKFHCFTLLRALGVKAPRTWQYRLEKGWVHGHPPLGTKVIAKPTYESWAVGVDEASVFIADESCSTHVEGLAERVGQDITVQEFITGIEVYVPVLSCPELVATSPMESVLTRAPGDLHAFVTLEDNLSDDAIFYRRFDGGEEVDRHLRSSALRVFDLLQLEGFGRIDFRIDADGQPWVFDIAISPGMERGGAGAKSLAEYGFDYPSFVRLVVAASMATKGLI